MADEPPPKPRGRPRLKADEPSVPLSVALPQSTSDRISQLASRNSVSRSAVVRVLLHRSLRKEP